ncbi:hypothetical protein Ocin01_18915 [Orchesella cincta]|uniref:Uncharacterized protein n=1 Tax=Orchesella cincta TaxID=48709 RepID=A0A1D2M459_ORCCI|nr:hypothetical protein Ocin01_18915 [Orchesella cincta]
MLVETIQILNIVTNSPRADPYGTIDFPSDDWGNGESANNEILVIASSLKIGADDDPFTMPTTMSWSSGAGCGGIFIGNGEISYKEDGKYANTEKVCLTNTMFTSHGVNCDL